MDLFAVAVIAFMGAGYSLTVPAQWPRLATPQHVAVFLGAEVDGVRSSITLSRFEGETAVAAEAARSDQLRRFADYEVLNEWAAGDYFYRRYRWLRGGSVPMLQHQLFASRLVLTCSRVDCQQTGSDEEVFLVAVRSLRVQPIKQG